MKLVYAAIATGIIAATSALAGSPDQDPVVRSIMERFASEESHVPTYPFRELRLSGNSKMWQCRTYSAKKDDFRRSGPGDTVRFYVFDGQLLAYGPNTPVHFGYSREEGTRPTAPAFLDDVANVGEGLAGTLTTDRDLVVYLRVNRHRGALRRLVGGDLIMEVTTPTIDHTQQVASISNPHRGLAAYAVCPRNMAH